MSRLIDADLLKENCECTGKFEDNFCFMDLITLAKVIDAPPTAYDVDKVVEQMEDRSVLWSPVGWRNSYEILALDAEIKTVKGGGVNG